MRMKSRINEIEGVLFYLILLLHLLPLFLVHPFVTLDGPAHLYNTTLLWQLLSGPGPNCSAFFSFNPLPQPNWGGHLVMLFLSPFTAPLWAEKIVQLLIVFGTGWSFRKLVILLEPGAAWMSWLIFPFLYNFPFLMGFYNFSLALVLLFLWLGWWLRVHGRPRKTGQFIGASLFLLLLYFSHLVVFFLAGFCSGIIALVSKKSPSTHTRINDLKFLALCNLPGIVLSLLFLTHNGSAGYRGEVAWMPLHELIRDLLTGRMLVAYTYLAEREVSTMFAVLCLALLLTGLRYRSVQPWQFTFALLSGSLLLMVFLVPDSLASGGILSVRIIQLFYLFLILLMATLRLPVIASRLGAFFALAISVLFMNAHYDTQKQLEVEARNFIDAASQFPEDAVVVPLNYSGNWLHANLCCYTGAVKPLVILDNYEATYRNFPLIWNKGMNPEEHLGNNVSSSKPCIDIKASELKTGRKIDGVMAWLMPASDNDSCFLSLQAQLRAQGFTTSSTTEAQLHLFIRN
jgi:hypothetical protein